MHPQVDDFALLFEGAKGAYGTYTITDAPKENGKILGQGKSIAKPVTKELWNAHLMGKLGLGISPINEDSMARFAAIDVDIYPIDLKAINERIITNKLPLIVFRTKSGGAHIYIFITELMPATILQKKLRELAAFLGYGSCDIYPKQSKILVARGDTGNWINMPYADGDKTLRYALGPDGRALLTEAFIKYAFTKAISPRELSKLKWTIPESLPGGPPCLQQLVSQGFPEGTRNSGLVQLAIYAQKAYGDMWEKHVEEYNQQFFDPPLSTSEVLGVIKSVRKKSYNYACKSQPLQPHCNAAICRTCMYGVGGAELGMPKMGTLTKLTTVPPIWFLDVETEDGSARVELTTEELQSPRLFQARCMGFLNIMPIAHKMEVWQPIIMGLMKEVNIIDVPPEATPAGQMLLHLEAFCTSKVTARVAEELLLGKPWINGDYIHFRMMDFMRYLDRMKFKLLELNRITMIIQAIPGYTKHFHNLRGKGCNTIVVPTATFTSQSQPFDVPEQPQEPI